jgi:hypothetical protein
MDRNIIISNILKSDEKQKFISNLIENKAYNLCVSNGDESFGSDEFWKNFPRDFDYIMKAVNSTTKELVGFTLIQVGLRCEELIKGEVNCENKHDDTWYIYLICASSKAR